MLAILTTHPIQYQVPLWQRLAESGEVPFEVWYLTDYGTKPSLDHGFGKTFSWDIDTLAGYPHRFIGAAPGAVPNSFLKCRLGEPLRKRIRSSGTRALLVQGWGVAAYWQAVREAKAAGAEVWVRGDSHELAPRAPWKRIAKRLILGQFFRNVDRFLCVGTANRRLYQRFGVPDSRLWMAPHAVDNARFARQAAMLRPDRATIRRAWGIKDGAFCVLFCGKFMPVKRPMDLVRTADFLRSRYRQPEVHLLFTGAGELGGQLRAACNVVYDADGAAAPPQVSADVTPGNARPRASFTGFLNQTDISRAYVAADCLVLPSASETWGLVVNEALASALPSFVSDGCGCADDLAGAGFTFPVGDIATLGDRLATFHASSDMVLAHPASFDESIATIIAVYRDSLRTGRRR